ncbi:hypothetical protein GCM10027049_21940 [Mucilaginibacter puniceus]
MKQYILKPGKHQFAPGSPAIHDNDNLSDEEAKWYLEKFPHIESLFEKLPTKDKLIKAKRKRIATKKTHSAPHE